MTRTGSILCLCLLTGLGLFAENSETYLPLFTIARSNNANVVHYEAKLTADGRLDPREPIVAYWVMAAEDGRRQALNLLERTKAYGFFTRDEHNDSYGMFLVSDRRREIQVRREGGVVRAVTTIAGRSAYLQKIFITTRRSLLITVPDAAELFGVDVATGEPRSEKVRP